VTPSRRADLLARLLPLLAHRPLLVTGDVGDRGPDTRGVIDALVSRGALGVLGNHDLWLAAGAAGEGFDRLALAPGGPDVARQRARGPPDRAASARAPLPDRGLGGCRIAASAALVPPLDEG